jgi:hypothetical protein
MIELRLLHQIEKMIAGWEKSKEGAGYRSPQWQLCCNAISDLNELKTITLDNKLNGEVQ